MEHRLDLRPELRQRADDEMLERRALERREQVGTHTVQMIVDVLLDGTLVSRLRPTTLRVLTMDRVADRARLLERIAIADEHAHRRPVDERYHPPFGRDASRERLDVRRIADHDVGL